MLLYVDPVKVSYLTQAMVVALMLFIPLIILIIVIVCIVKSNNKIKKEREYKDIMMKLESLKRQNDENIQHENNNSGIQRK